MHFLNFSFSLFRDLIFPFLPVLESEKSGKPLRNMTEAYRAVEGLIEKACDIYKFLIKKSLQISELNATNANLKIPNDKPVEASIKVYSLAKSLSRLGGKFFALDKANDSALITSSTALKIKFSELRGYQNLVERVVFFLFCLT